MVREIGKARLAEVKVPQWPRSPGVLPLSNLPGFLPPFLLRPDQAMTLAG